MELTFSLSFVLVVPFWVLMIFAPRWRVTERLLRSPYMVAPAAVLYVVLIAPTFVSVFVELLTPDLLSVAALLGDPRGALIAWAHFLAFDLFVGRWAYLDSRNRGAHPLVMAPILFLILMAGPVGLVLYLIAARFAPPTAGQEVVADS